MGQDGAKLSGGQRQRVSLARAILKNPQILLLDEPTASLDNLSEQCLIQTLSDCPATILVATHRLPLARSANRILVVDNGEIAQEGTHTDLIQVEGIYKELWCAEDQLAKAS